MSSFCTARKSYSHFLSKKYQNICVSLDVNFNELLTNDIVSFEQLGPGYLIIMNNHNIRKNIYLDTTPELCKELEKRKKKKKYCSVQ